MPGVRTLGVVIRQPLSNPGAGLRASFKGIHVDAFVFQGSPKTFDHTVIDPAATPIHGNLDLGIFQRLRSLKTGEPM